MGEPELKYCTLGKTKGHKYRTGRPQGRNTGGEGGGWGARTDSLRKKFHKLE